MDILHLVDRLEELFNESRPIWFTHSVVINEERMLDIIDQMRVSIPEEIKKAQQILAQHDRIVAKAQEEAANILAQARRESETMVERDPIVEAARVRAEEILASVRETNDRTKHEADEYVLTTLTGLEGELERILNQVRNGIRTVQSEKQTAVKDSRENA